MRQQFQQEEETQQGRSVIPAPSPVAEKRYDTETVQQVIARATRLQTEYRETLSARQIEEIGAEVGLDPVFIRHALAEMETGGVTQLTASPHVETSPSRASVIASVSISTFYAVLLYLVQGTARGNISLIDIFAMTAPVFLAIGIGAGVKSKRWGAAMGAYLGTAILVSLLIFSLNRGDPTPLWPVLGYWVGMTAAGAVAGALGAAIRKHGLPALDALLDKTNSHPNHPLRG